MTLSKNTPLSSELLESLMEGGSGLQPGTQEFVNFLRNARVIDGCFLDGEIVPAISGSKYANISPINGKKINDIADCDAEDVAAAVRSAKIAYETGEWSALSNSARKGILIELARLLKENANELAALDALDVGKPFEMARNIDMWATVDTFSWYAELCDKLEGRMAPTDNFDILVREPLGVVAAVLPWNYPSMILAWKVAPMLAAGNSVVVKPAEQSPLSALRIAELAFEAGVPKGVLNVVTGDGPRVGAPLGLHPDVDALGFTGSSEVGKKFLEYSGGSNMKKVSLECGGKSPMIVFEDSDIAKAASSLASAIFYNAGQSCNAPSRAIVHESEMEAFLKTLSEEARNYRPGNPFREGTSVGAIISQKQIDKIEGLIDAAESAGANIVTGGKRIHDSSGGFYFEPTIIANSTQEMAINQEEIFGPVVTVQSFSTFDEAIEIANDTRFGLWANVWTNDLKMAVDAAKLIKAGTVAFNCVWGGATSIPMGGYKESGIGRELGIDGIHNYTQTKHISLLPPS